MTVNDLYKYLNEDTNVNLINRNFIKDAHQLYSGKVKNIPIPFGSYAVFKISVVNGALEIDCYVSLLG